MTTTSQHGSGGKRTYPTPRWNFSKLLRSKGLGSAAVIREKLLLRGYDAPPVESIAGWRKRNSVPGAWVPIIIDVAIEEGVIRNIRELSMSPAPPQV